MQYEIREAPLFLNLCVEEQCNGVNVKKKAHVNAKYHTSRLLPALSPPTLTSTFTVILLISFATVLLRVLQRAFITMATTEAR